jgi:hypothetical protein
MMASKESKYSPRRIEAQAKQQRALGLRMAGRTWAEIAEAVGYSNHTGAIAAVKVALQQSLQEPAQYYKALTLERLTKVLQVHWPSMINHNMLATDKVLRVLADIRALLGLDAPIKEDIMIVGTNYDDPRAELDARLITILERRAKAQGLGLPVSRTEPASLVGLEALGEGKSVSTNGSMVHLDAPDGSGSREDS